MASPASIPPPGIPRPPGRHATPRPRRSPRPGTPEGASPSPSRPASPRWLARLAGGLLHPLTVICAVQAAASLTLVWSNTAFTDEADYLRLGHILIAHWLHGTSW